MFDRLYRHWATRDQRGEIDKALAEVHEAWAAGKRLSQPATPGDGGADGNPI